jgi:hypothetical protein
VQGTVAKIKEKARQLVGKREKFLVLEVASQGTNALFLSVDDDQNLDLEKFIEGADLEKFLRSPFRQLTQKSWEGNYLFKSHRKIIVAAHPAIATTMPIPLDLGRDRELWKEEVSVEELENLIAQAMAKVFTQCRSEAAKRIAADDLDTILVGAKSEYFKIDGHTVMNPVGFTGKKISLLLELTFTRRDVFENLKQFFNSPDEFFFIESPQAFLHSVARVRDLPVSVIAPDNDGGSALFILQKADGGQPILYREKLPWSFATIVRRIADELGVGPEAAGELYHAYCNGKLSATAERGFRKMLQPSTDALFDAMEKAKLSGYVYLDTPEPVPFDLPRKGKGLVLEALPTEEIMEEFDLRFSDAVTEDLRVKFRNFAPFLESYFAKSTSEINQKLRRRLHWLAE